MKQIINKINQLADSLTELRLIHKTNMQERNNISSLISEYERNLEEAGKVGANDYMMPSQQIIERQAAETAKFKNLIAVEQKKIVITNSKNTRLVADIMSTKEKLNNARGEYLEAKKQTLLQDPILIKAKKLISECVSVGYIAYEGFLNADALIEELFEQLPEINDKQESSIKQDIRADVVAGTGRL